MKRKVRQKDELLNELAYAVYDVGELQFNYDNDMMTFEIFQREYWREVEKIAVILWALGEISMFDTRYLDKKEIIGKALALLDYANITYSND